MYCIFVLFIVCLILFVFVFFFFKQKTAYEFRISDWSSDVCSSDLPDNRGRAAAAGAARHLVRHRFAPRRPGPAVLSDLLRRAARHRFEADLGWRRGAGLARVVGPERSAVKRPSCFALTRALPDSGGAACRSGCAAIRPGGRRGREQSGSSRERASTEERLVGREG